MWRFLICLLCAAFLLSACEQGDSRAVFERPQFPVLDVQVSRVVLQAVPHFYMAPGHTIASQSIAVSTQQSGFITELPVNEGDVVEAGGLLLSLDESDWLEALKQAESALQAAQIRLRDAREDVNAAEKLGTSRAVSEEQLRKSNVQFNLAQAQLAQAETALRREQAKAPYFHIKSPVRARVLKRYANQGDLAVTGKVLLLLESMQSLEFETALPVSWISLVHLGDTVELSLHDNNASLNAQIIAIIRSAYPLTQSYKIKLSLPEIPDLTAGLSGQANFELGQNEHLLVAEAALTKRAGVQGVFRLDGKNKAWFTPLNTERSYQQKRVVLSGLQADEQVVLNPPAELHDGQVVHVR